MLLDLGLNLAQKILGGNGFVSRSASASVPYAPTTFASPSSATGSVAACSVPAPYPLCYGYFLCLLLALLL